MHLKTRFRPLALAAALWAASPIGAQEVHIIDQAAGPGTDYTNLDQSVLDDAAGGDVLILRPGQYNAGTLSIVGKGLTILSERGDVTLNVGNALFVRNLALTDHVLLRGLDIVGNNHAVFGDDCLGRIVIDDCRLAIADFGLGSLRVTDCSDVLLARVELMEPANGSFSIGNLDANTSKLYVYDSILQGNANAAVGLRATTAMFSGCALIGSGSFALIGLTGSKVEMRDSNVFPGSTSAYSLDGTSAVDFTAIPALSLDVTSPVLQGVSTELRFLTEPDTQVWALSALGGVHGFEFAAVDGTLHVFGAGFNIDFMGTSGALGELDVETIVPLIPGLSTAQINLQPLAQPPSTGRFQFGTPRTVTVY